MSGGNGQSDWRLRLQQLSTPAKERVTRTTREAMAYPSITIIIMNMMTRIIMTALMRIKTLLRMVRAKTSRVVKMPKRV